VRAETDACAFPDIRPTATAVTTASSALMLALGLLMLPLLPVGVVEVGQGTRRVSRAQDNRVPTA
jgi:hypothetical protein